MEGKKRFGKVYGEFPIDGETWEDEEGVHTITFYDKICLCEEHLWEYENGEGIYEEQY